MAKRNETNARSFSLEAGTRALSLEKDAPEAVNARSVLTKISRELRDEASAFLCTECLMLTRTVPDLQAHHSYNKYIMTGSVSITHPDYFKAGCLFAANKHIKLEATQIMLKLISLTIVTLEIFQSPAERLTTNCGTSRLIIDQSSPQGRVTAFLTYDMHIKISRPQTTSSAIETQELRDNTLDKARHVMLIGR
jgi:hypothetical protein